MQAYSERQAMEVDIDYIYNLSEITMRSHVEATWGIWDDEWQVARFRSYYQPETWRIIIVDSVNVGAYETRLTESSLFLARLYIIPEYQGRGIGSSIIRNLIEKANYNHIPLTLDVLMSNPNAQRLYLKLGFVVTGETAERSYMSTLNTRSNS